MFNAFASARLWLANLDPAAPAVALMLFVFAAIYSIRRWLPSVWLLVEKSVPFVDSLDYRPAATVLWKTWQAWPAAALGAVTAALSTGGSAVGALKGAALGAAVAVVHEIAAAYKGKAGDPKPPSARGTALTGLCFVLTLVLACGLPGCSVFGPGGSVWPAVATCAPSSSSLVQQVAAILLAGGDYEAALLELAKKTTKEAVVCAAEVATAELRSKGKLGASPENMAASARGKAFLKQSGNAQ